MEVSNRELVEDTSSRQVSNHQCLLWHEVSTANALIRCDHLRSLQKRITIQKVLVAHGIAAAWNSGLYSWKNALIVH